jgi:hypothetical protein
MVSLPYEMHWHCLRGHSCVQDSGMWRCACITIAKAGFPATVTSIPIVLACRVGNADVLSNGMVTYMRQ